jgi:uracil-DNA glycosylase
MPNTEAIPPSWRPALEPVLATPKSRALDGFLTAEEAAGKAIYPPARFRSG